MLDKREQFLLNYVNKNTVNGYVVISLNELCKEVVENSNYSTDGLVVVIRTLSSLGYIRLKYDDGENFCVASTEKGRSFVDVDEENEKTYIKLFSGYKRVVGWVTASAFIGAFAGAVVVLVIFSLVRR